MADTRDVKSSQPGGNKTGKQGRKGKNKLEKQTTGQGGALQASTSQIPADQGDLSQRIETMQISARGPPQGSVGVAPGKRDPGQGSTPKKSMKKDSKSDSGPVLNIKDAFDKEDAEYEGIKKTRRLKASAEDSFAELETLTGLSLKHSGQTALCLRPEFRSGCAGDLTRVSTNFFRLAVKGNTIYQYVVTFLKADESVAVKKELEVGRVFKRLTKRMNQALLDQFVQTTGSELFRGVEHAYDNDRILITNKPLASITKEGQIFDFKFVEKDGDPTPQNVFIRIMATVSLPLTVNIGDESKLNVVHNRAVLQVIDIISKSHAFKHDIIYGSKIFLSAQARARREMRVRDEATPYELAFGYHQSTQLCQIGAVQNIDRATAVLYKGGPLIRTMELLLQRRFDGREQLSNADHEALKELTFLRIETHYRGFTSRHTLRSFTLKPCSEIFFDDANVRKSVSDYFRQHYAINLKYPNLPCVDYSQNRYIPVELCTILPDQRNQRKLRDELIRIVSEFTTKQKPYERERGTVEIAQNISQQLSDNAFNIKLNATPVTVQSRILSAPALKYGNIQNYKPEIPGSWDMQRKSFLKPNSLTKWALFTLVSRKMDKSVAGMFVNKLQNAGNMLGMKITNPVLPHELLQPKDLVPTFKKCQGMGLQLILIMMPENSEFYSKVKSIGDKGLGVPTQVVLDKHYDMRAQSADGRRQKIFDMAYLCNLLLKINMKIGGTNLKLSDNTRCSILNDKTMVVGIDVNHPSPGDDSPSIAAVVGSLDEAFSQYRTEIRLNSSRDEIVQVDEMIVPILKAFKGSRGFYPEHIIVYRDGVSEGQFSHVMGKEILPLHKKIETLPTRPMLTYMVVQKRHNTRFFPTDRNKATKSGNILPGSVIDTDIVHYKWFDFYLCSQNSFLGTARPGKYTVLWHSSPATADDLQMATYYLCYLFARATKSIADPAPARYAHHAAARGKVHLKDILRNRPRGNNQAIAQELNSAITVVGHLQQILYFI